MSYIKVPDAGAILGELAPRSSWRFRASVSRNMVGWLLFRSFLLGKIGYQERMERGCGKNPKIKSKADYPGNLLHPF